MGSDGGAREKVKGLPELSCMWYYEEMQKYKTICNYHEHYANVVCWNLNSGTP